MVENHDAAGKYNGESWRDRDFRCGRCSHADRRRLPLRGLFLGLTLLLLGTIFMLNQAGWLSGDIWWQSLLIGLGVICFIDGIVRTPVLGFRWGGFGRFMIGTIFILAGVLTMLGFGAYWPLILIAVGLMFILRLFIHSR